MCGISGIYASSISEKHHRIVNSIIENQFKRGPDFNAMICIKEINAEVLLGHNRLSIIDLSAHGNQPMWDVTNRFCIVFNGEIYNYLELRTELKKRNYEFNTHSDTEVILNAFCEWGADALPLFQGPFAFALFDTKTSELWLCRDRFGVRPLFYTIINNELYFASTSNVLAKELKLSPNLDYVAQGLKYLVYEDNSQQTAYENLFSLPNRYYLKVKYNESQKLVTELNTYYDLEKNVEHLIHTLPTDNTANLIEKTMDTLQHAITIRLRADVPVALSLSSGLDSSTIAALTSQLHPNIQGFSFSHPENKKSEGPLVAQCAKWINIPVHYVWPSDTDMINAFFKTIEVQDAPFPSLSIVAQYLLYQKVNSANIKVLLGGQGGDEAFMGYKKFIIFSLQQSIKNKHLLATLKKTFALLPMLFAEIPSILSYWGHRHRYNKKQGNNTILAVPDSHRLSLGHTTNPLWKRQIHDIQQFTLPSLLRYEDRNAMSHSVESRLPFMDHQLIELALALPEALKLSRGYGKWVVRHIMKDKIPPAISMARFKRGFDVPLKKLIRAGLGNAIRSRLKMNMTQCQSFLRHPSQFDNDFSDTALLSHNRLHEAIVLLWLNKNS